MVVLCDGMIRSGSTWSFNVALELIRQKLPGRKAYGLYSENPAVILAAVRPRTSHLVVKSHSIDPSAYELCCGGSVKAIYTWRHPYDAIASAVKMFGYPLDHWMGALRNALRVWSFHLATGSGCIVSYESIVRTPADTVRGIAAFLGLRIEPAQAERIAEALVADRLKGFTQTIERLEHSRLVRKSGYCYDRQTLLHHNHIRDGRIGYGAEFFDAEQLAAIDAMLREEGFELPYVGRDRHAAAC